MLFIMALYLYCMWHSPLITLITWRFSLLRFVHFISPKSGEENILTEECSLKNDSLPVNIVLFWYKCFDIRCNAFEALFSCLTMQKQNKIFYITHITWICFKNPEKVTKIGIYCKYMILSRYNYNVLHFMSI